MAHLSFFFFLFYKVSLFFHHHKKLHASPDQNHVTLFFLWEKARPDF